MKMETSISEIPDGILQLILRNLCAEDLITACRVNQRWNRIAYSSCNAWVDLSKFKLRFKIHWSSVHKMLSSNTKALLISCHNKPEWRPVYRSWKHNGNRLTLSMIKDIREKSTKLLHLSLYNQDFYPIKLHFLPATLVKLDLTNSSLPEDFFADIARKQPMPNLKCLNISSCEIDCHETVIRDICDRWPGLTNLNIRNFFGRGSGLASLGRLVQLTHLDISNTGTYYTQITSYGVRTICESLKRLESFKLGGTHVELSKVMDSLVTLPELKELDLSGNKSIRNDHNLMRLIALRKLEVLTVYSRLGRINASEISEFRASHPNTKNLTINLPSELW